MSSDGSHRLYTSRLLVLDHSTIGASRARSQNLAVLLNVDGISAANAYGTSVSSSGGARECDLAEVGEGHKAASLLEVLDDPLCVLSSEGLAADGCGNRLAGARVLDGGSAAG